MGQGSCTRPRSLHGTQQRGRRFTVVAPATACCKPCALPLPQDILAPLLHVNELRRHGVTLHMLLDADRQPIPDVPAVYFVQVPA